MAFCFGIGFLSAGIRALFDVLKKAGELNDAAAGMFMTMLGGFLLAFAVIGQKLIDKTIAQLKRLGLLKDLPPD